VEFVKNPEVMHLLREHGISPEASEEDRVHLRHEGAEGVVRLHLTSPETEVDTAPEEGSRVVSVARERLPGMVDDVIHKLRLREILLIPVGKWRHVFDAVAFSLAENEDWQEFDAAVTVELNGRDPLLCEPGDFQTISALMRALLSDADRPEQGVMLTTTTIPLLMEVVPAGAIRVSFGSQVLADEILEVFESTAG